MAHIIDEIQARSALCTICSGRIIAVNTTSSVVVASGRRKPCWDTFGMCVLISRSDERQMAARAIPTLLKHSSSHLLAEAKREWACGGRGVKPEDEEFTDKCRLCGQTGLNEMVWINNGLTNYALLVGLNCAIRYTRQGTAVSDDDNRKLIMARLAEYDRRQEQLIVLPKVQELLPRLLSPDASYSDKRKFGRLSKSFLGEKLEHASDADRLTAYFREVLGRDPEVGESFRLRYHLHVVRDELRTENSNNKMKKDDPAVGKWANTSRTKSQVNTSLSRSQGYRNPADT